MSATCQYCHMAGINPPRPSVGKTLGNYHVCRECADFYGLRIIVKKDEQKDDKQSEVKK